MQKWVPDVQKAKDALGFGCTTSLDELPDEVIPWVTQGATDGRL